MAFAVMQCFFSLSGISTRETYFERYQGVWDVMVTIKDAEADTFEETEIVQGLDGAVILNRIRNVTNPDFRHPVFMLYIKDKNTASILRQSGNEEIMAEIPVLSYTEKVPVLREEYAMLDYYELVHFIPVSLWKGIKGQIGGMEKGSYICVKRRENVTLEELSTLQNEILHLIGGKYAIKCENRIQEYETNKKQIQGMVALFGGFCILLAMIGIGNVFSNILGYVRQRKREFARYMSVGLTPKELRKMFCIEALVIAGRPVLISLLLAIIAVGYMLKASYVDVGEFMAEAPLIPIILFLLAILGSVTLAYYLAWRNIRKISLAEVLRDDTMMWRINIVGRD